MCLKQLQQPQQSVNGCTSPDTHPPPADLQHDEHKVVVLEEAVEADDVVVVETLVDADLRGHLLPLVLLQDQ